MEKLSSNAGWLWVKEGFALFRKQPAETATLFLSYMFLMLAVGIIPVVGQVLPMLLVPLFSMSFMQACANIEQRKKVYPNLLLVGFRSPAAGRLLSLGALYLLAAIAAIAASALVDGGMFWRIMSGQQDLDQQTVSNSSMSLAMLFSGIVYLPAAMAFWYAAPLIAWQRMGLFKALFYSFFAVLRARKAFLVYGLAWILIGVVAPAMLSSILSLIFPRTMVVMIVLLPLSLLMTVVMYCSFYPTYTHIFGRQQQAEPIGPATSA